jgi:peptidoglycan hydrolase-like protein with peptidoglycan-binding domain
MKKRFLNYKILLSLLFVLFSAFLPTASSRAANPLVTPVQTVPAPPWPICQPGCTGENVYTLQLFLLQHRLAIPLNGHFDRYTQAAIKSFQHNKLLIPDGSVGQGTWPHLLTHLSLGNLGLPVIALQRQLIAHGAILVPTGEYDLPTQRVISGFQRSWGQSGNGQVNMNFWRFLLTKPTSITVPPPPSFASGHTLWGIDTATSITLPKLQQISQKFGKPAFIGKYLTSNNFTPLTATEVSLIHAQNIRILLLETDYGHNTGTKNAEKRATMAVKQAEKLGVPHGVAIFADLEPGDKLDTAWIETWYRVIRQHNYTAGFYANPFASRNFNGPYCAAVSHQPEIARHAILDIFQPMLTRSSAINAPAFTPALPYCGTQPTGHVLIWQYGLSGGDPITNVDTDLLKDTVPLW